MVLFIPIKALIDLHDSDTRGYGTNVCKKYAYIVG